MTWGARGLSAAVAAVTAIVFLIIGLYASILVLQRVGGGGAAQMAGIHRGVGEEHVALRIFIEPAENDKTRIEFINRWGDVVKIDYIAVVDRRGSVVAECRGDSIPPALKYILPGRRVELKPSDIGLQTKYDDDYWAMKRDISHIIAHDSRGSVFTSIYGRPPEEIYPVYVKTTWTFTTSTTGVTTVTSTSWVTKTTTITTTTNVG